MARDMIDQGNAGKVSDRLVQALPWLDAASEKLQAVGEPLLGEDAPRGPRDLLNGTWLGHPLHPVVVTMPIGFWSGAAALDLAGEERAADLLLGWGVLSAIAAAATGAAQLQDAMNDERPRRLGTLHALTNSVALSLNALSWLARRNGNRGLGQTLSLAGLGTVMAGGWLGGDLSFELGLGVNHTAFQSPPEDWTTACELSDLQPGVPIRIELENAPVLLLLHDDGLHAIGAVCPHLGGPLDEGAIEGECVTCPWHASVFDLRDGALIHGPATAPAIPYETRIVNGEVQVRVRR